MKKMLSVIICVLVVVTLFAGCAGSPAEEAQDAGANYMPEQSTLDSIADDSVALISEDPPEEIRTHHYGKFDDIVYGSSPHLYATTLDELEYMATNIVIGRMKDDATIVVPFNEEFGRRYFGSNMVSFEITEVIMGDFTIGEIIRLGEPYYIYEGVLYALDYMPSIPHQEYVLFLAAQVTTSSVPEYIGAFGPAYHERSRFPVPGGFCRERIKRYLDEDGRFSSDLQDFESPVFGLGSQANVVIYSRLWEEVMNAYILPTLAS